MREKCMAHYVFIHITYFSCFIILSFTRYKHVLFCKNKLLNSNKNNNFLYAFKTSDNDKL